MRVVSVIACDIATFIGTQTGAFLSWSSRSARSECGTSVRGLISRAIGFQSVGLVQLDRAVRFWAQFAVWRLARRFLCTAKLMPLKCVWVVRFFVIFK